MAQRTASARAPHGQIAETRVYPDPHSSCYYTVRLFDGRRSFHRFVATERGDSRRALRRCYAMYCPITVHGYPTSGRQRTLPKHGELLFTLPEFTAEAIAHECGHAALDWRARRAVRFLRGPETEPNETVCYALGRLVAQIAAFALIHDPQRVSRG